MPRVSRYRSRSPDVFCAALLLAGIALSSLRPRARPATHQAKPVIGHWSDCAVHNGPALPVGPCNCGGIIYPGTVH